MAALASLMVATGCGDFDLPDQKTGPALVTRAQLKRYPATSPARQVLEWWRALQFLDPALARRYYAQGARPSEARLARQLSVGHEELGTSRRPRIAGVDRRRWEAKVLVVLTKRTHQPNGRVDEDHAPHTFTLVLEQGRWKLADNRYLEFAARHASTR